LGVYSLLRVNFFQVEALFGRGAGSADPVRNANYGVPWSLDPVDSQPAKKYRLFICGGSTISIGYTRFQSPSAFRLLQ
jgi:hypothetical protein